MTNDHVDVMIVGAGLSGIAAAYYLKTRCPNKTYTILEGRDSIGGTWDLFKFPGIRSDSSMYTLGYRFRPWQKANGIAQGDEILDYIKDTAAEYGIDKQICFQHRVCRISWSSDKALWTVNVQRDKEGDTIQLTCNLLFMCTGYYDYDKGYTPEWQGMERFQGCIVHPQKWDTDFDYTGKKVVVIGSGATAVTMIPVIAKKAAHVTMLQRSPTYIVPLPSADPATLWLRDKLPDRLASWVIRWRSILYSIRDFSYARKRPEETKREILAGIKMILGEDYDVDKHFSPTYKVWDQRVCLAPDGDFFFAIRSGNASVVTDHIETFTETGIKLKSGNTLDADVIVTATGLNMKIMNNIQILVDGQPIELSDTLSYKGMMYSNIPNLVSSFGYTNASWTLKAELICEYVVRMLKYMDQHGYVQVMARLDQAIETEAYINFTSGYVQRAKDSLPKQGTERPWKVYQNYLKDLIMMRFGSLNDGVMEFKKQKNS